MKLLILTLLNSLWVARSAHPSTTFGRGLRFGIRCGGDAAKKVVNDYEEAEQAIFHGIEMVEVKVHKAVEEEVHAMFPDMDHEQKAKVMDHAKAAVSKGASKIKLAAQEHSKARLMPFLPKHLGEVEHNDHRVLHAMEEAEKAVLRAIQDEVDTIFHGADEDHPLQKGNATNAKKAQQSVKKGVQKAGKDVKDSHQERQSWIKESDAKAIKEFIESSASAYKYCTGWE